MSPSTALAIAAAVLAAGGEIPAEQTADAALYGALTITGEIAPLRGTLAAAAAHRSRGCTGPLLYAGSPLPADLAPVNSRPVSQLTDLATSPSRPQAPSAPAGSTSASACPLDYLDVRGRGEAIFALTVAAAGGHSVLLRGGPGSRADW